MKKIFLVLFLFCVLCFSSFAKNADCDKGIEVIYNQTGTYIFKIDTRKFADKIKPVIDYSTANELFQKGQHKLVINAGFFDVENQQSVSYVVIDKKTVEDPRTNAKMIASLEQDGRLEKVLNRPELRILENKRGKNKLEIAKHTDVAPKGWEIKHSIQGGPMLIPDYNLEEEGFIKKNEKEKIVFESAAVLKRRARTIVGLKGKYLYIIVFTNRAKIATNEAKEFCEKLKLKSAMAFDGGGSTSLNYKNIKVISEGKNGRKVKSFLTIENRE